MIKILNSSPGFGSVLSEQEVKNFLTNNKYNIHLGTVDEKGHPNIHPTWYYFEASNHKFYVETSKHSKKVSNVRKNEGMYFCVDDPQPPYKGVRGKGTARIHENIDHNIPIAEKIMTRYLGNLEHPMARALLNAVEKGESVILEISPYYYSTWDYRKSG
jgi:general stress protein 26